MSELICKSCKGKEFYKVPGFYICKACGRKISELEAARAEAMVIGNKKPEAKSTEKPRLEVKMPGAKANYKPETKACLKVEPKHELKKKEPKKPKAQVSVEIPKVSLPRVKNNDISIKEEINDEKVIDSLLVFAYDSYRNKDYIKAEEYANRIIEINPKSVDAWLIKGNSASFKTSNIIFRLEDSIKYWYNAILYAKPDEVDDLSYSINARLIEVASDFTAHELDGFIINPSHSYLAKLKDTIKYLEPIIKKASSLLGLDEGLYYEIVSYKLYLLVNSSYMRAMDEFNVENIRRTDKLYEALREKVNSCIEILEYDMQMVILAKTMNAILKTLFKCHSSIINLCGYKLSGHKPKPSLECSAIERKERIDRLKSYEDWIRKKFLRDEDLNLDIKNPLNELGRLNKEVKALEERKNNLPERIKLNDLIDNQAQESLIPLKREVQAKELKLSLEMDSNYRKILAITIRYNLNKL